MQQLLPSCLEPPTDGSPWAPPLDVCDVVVRMETVGITDSVAREDCGFKDTWHFAATCFPWLKVFPAIGSSRKQAMRWWREYALGLVFAIPLLLCSAAMGLLRFSLWGGDVSGDLAAAVGLGTVSSFVVTGGVIQAMARRCLFLLGAAEKTAARHGCFRWAGIGIVLALFSAAVLVAGCRYFEWLPPRVVWVFVAFHLSLCLLWLGVGILHLLERSAHIALATSIGIAVVVGLHAGLHVALPQSQVSGILAVAAYSLAMGIRLFPGPGVVGVHVRRTFSADLLIVWPYLAFGSLYYLLLFGDRLLAWTVTDLSASSAILFRGNYETGLDIVLIAFVLLVGWIRPAVVGFFTEVQRTQATLSLAHRADFSHKMRKHYFLQLLRFIGLSVSIALAVYFGAIRLGALHDPAVHLVVIWGLAAYPWLVLGLWNANLHFRFGRPLQAALSLAPAVAVEFIVGYLASRLGSYELAIVGSAAGAVCFGMVSTTQILRRLDVLDYDYFASAL